MDRVDCIVIGAGVIGLACARALAAAGLQTIVLEAESRIGSGVSSRSSEVIHAGIYYAPGSLKARLCVLGRELLYQYLGERGLPHRRLGKLIVATEQAHLASLARLQSLGMTNGVERLEMLDAGRAAVLEPTLRCCGALHSPDTGIVDSHALMVSLSGDLEASGGSIALRSPMQRARRHQNAWWLTTGDGEGYHILCDVLVNAAGLSAQHVAGTIEEYPHDRIPALRMARGNYFSLSQRAPFARLIYPLPTDGGIGIHLTLDMGGIAKFGPDVEWIDEVDFNVDPARAQVFYENIRAFWPQLPDGTLQPAYAGIRPKLSGPGEPARDFLIDGPGEHGLPGLIQLFGFESPGLTSALAIGERVAKLALDR
ncbi:MAG TPA: NAD(P)/FAD-dependent oxidoreductase [Burkholderiaceae bacterium]